MFKGFYWSITLENIGCDLIGILVKCGAYFEILNMRITEAIIIIDGVIKQYFNERVHNQFVLENTIYQVLNGESLDYMDYVGSSKNNLTYAEKVHKVEKIKNKQNKLLEKLL